MSAGRIRYGDSGLDDIASLLVQRLPIAADYLEQAPVIAPLAAARYRTHITYGEVDRAADMLAAQPKLKAVMRILGVPVQLRALQAAALKPRDHHVIAELSKLDPSTLAQIIPVDSQRVWLDACDKWLSATRPRRGTRTTVSIAWVARHLTADMSRYEQVDAVADFVARGGGEINAAWSWQAALANVQAWHDRLHDHPRIARMIADERRQADFDKVICRAPLPDHIDLNGYSFTTLRTARALHEEGVAMHHCVASYAGLVAAGKTAVVSIKRDGVHVATLEVDAKGRLAQLKSHCNAAPTAETRNAADLYALTYWQPQQQAQAA